MRDQLCFRINIENADKWFPRTAGVLASGMGKLDTRLGCSYLVSGSDLLQAVTFMVELEVEQMIAEGVFVNCCVRGSQRHGFLSGLCCRASDHAHLQPVEMFFRDSSASKSLILI